MAERFEPSAVSSKYMVRWGAGNPERAVAKGCQVKLCFTATDLDFLVELLYELSLDERCMFVKYSHTAKDGMYLGRCFMDDVALIGELWQKYKLHPKLMCSIQDDTAVDRFRAD